MQFYFDSWAEFVKMNGQGPYVWAAYAITWLVLSYLLLSPWLRKRRWLARERDRLRRQTTHEAPSRTDIL